MEKATNTNGVKITPYVRKKRNHKMSDEKQKPKIDDMKKYVEDKAREMALGSDFDYYMFSHRIKVFKKLITQIISEVQREKQ